MSSIGFYLILRLIERAQKFKHEIKSINILIFHIQELNENGYCTPRCFVFDLGISSSRVINRLKTG